MEILALAFLALVTIGRVSLRWKRRHPTEAFLSELNEKPLSHYLR